MAQIKAYITLLYLALPSLLIGYTLDENSAIDCVNHPLRFSFTCSEDYQRRLPPPLLASPRSCRLSARRIKIDETSRVSEQRRVPTFVSSVGGNRGLNGSGRGWTNSRRRIRVATSVRALVNYDIPSLRPTGNGVSISGSPAALCARASAEKRGRGKRKEEQASGRRRRRKRRKRKTGRKSCVHVRKYGIEETRTPSLALLSPARKKSVPRRKSVPTASTSRQPRVYARGRALARSPARVWQRTGSCDRDLRTLL